MSVPKKNDFVPYGNTRPGFESVYTGVQALPEASRRDSHLQYGQDADGNVYMTYSSWGFAKLTEADWNEEIRHINVLQQRLGDLDASPRLIRAQIASLQGCDSGVPMTIDEILSAIGTNELRQPAFHAGCWLSMSTRGTQPGQNPRQLQARVLREPEDD